MQPSELVRQHIRRRLCLRRLCKFDKVGIGALKSGRELELLLPTGRLQLVATIVSQFQASAQPRLHEAALLSLPASKKTVELMWTCIRVGNQADSIRVTVDDIIVVTLKLPSSSKQQYPPYLPHQARLKPTEVIEALIPKRLPKELHPPSTFRRAQQGAEVLQSTCQNTVFGV